MMQFCSLTELSATQALFSGFGGLILFLLICVTAVFCITAMWLSPVSGAISSREKTSQNPKNVLSFWFILISTLCILTIITSLYLTFFPYQCIKHASLISAAKPVGSTSWNNDLSSFKKDFPQTTQCDRYSHCLGNVSNKILVELASSQTISAKLNEKDLAEKIITEVKAFVDDPSEVFAICDKHCIDHLSPSLIESVELSVIMAWEAYTSTNKQTIKYFVSDRAHKYNWNWKGLESLFKVDANHLKNKLEVRLTPAQTTNPVLDKILSASKSDNYLTITFTLIPNDGGEIKLSIGDTKGKLIGQGASLSLPNQSSQTVLKKAIFHLPLGIPEYQLSLIQTSPSRIIRSLPKPRKIGVKVFVQGVSSNSGELSSTIAALGNNSFCSAYSPYNYSSWNKTVSAFMTPDTVSITTDISDSNVVVYLRSDGAMWVLPSHAVNPNLPLRTQPIPWLGNKALDDSTFIKTHNTREPIMVLYSSYDKGRAFSYDRLGMKINSNLKLRTIEKLASLSPPILAARLEKPSSLARDSLGFSPWKKGLYSPLKVRLVIPNESEVQSSSMTASLYALNTEALAVSCNTTKPIDQELFFAFWKSTFHDVYLATTPTVKLVKKKMDSYTGSPKIFIKADDLRQIKVDRVKGKLILAGIVFCIYAIFMIINIRRARE
jgi:hypothetical protein